MSSSERRIIPSIPVRPSSCRVWQRLLSGRLLSTSLAVCEYTPAFYAAMARGINHGFMTHATAMQFTASLLGITAEPMCNVCCHNSPPILATHISAQPSVTSPLPRNCCAKRVCASNVMPWRNIMRDTTLLGHWVCRFLLEHMVSERNLARNTQHSYRDALKLLISFAARRLHKAVDRLTVVDLSANLVRLFLADLETA